MGLFTRETAPGAPAEVAGPPTRDEFDGLRRELAAFRRIAAIACMTAEESGKYPGVSGGPGSAHLRMEKIAAVASEFGLDAAEVEELRGFLRLVEAARRAELNREAAVERERLEALQHPWDAQGRYRRRIV
jgi:hypothetical protein